MVQHHFERGKIQQESFEFVGQFSFRFNFNLTTLLPLKIFWRVDFNNRGFLFFLFVDFIQSSFDLIVLNDINENYLFTFWTVKRWYLVEFEIGRVTSVCRIIIAIIIDNPEMETRTLKSLT